MKRLVLSISVAIVASTLLTVPKTSAAAAQCLKLNSKNVWATATCPSSATAGKYYLLNYASSSIVQITQAQYTSLTGVAFTKVPAGCSGGPDGPPASGTVCPGTPSSSAAAAVGTPTNCPGVPTVGTGGLKIDCSGGKNPIYALLQFAINWLIGILLVLAVVAVVISGIQYILSQGNPDGIKAAKSRLTNAIVGLILLSLMFVILRVILKQ